MLIVIILSVVCAERCSFTVMLSVILSSVVMLDVVLPNYALQRYILIFN
jgi:hypothetical protein